MNKRRVVITGIGMISPLGTGNEPTWKGIIEGRSGVHRITKFDPTAFACQIAGEVLDFKPEDWIEKKEVKKEVKKKKTDKKAEAKAPEAPKMAEPAKK